HHDERTSQASRDPDGRGQSHGRPHHSGGHRTGEGGEHAARGGERRGGDGLPPPLRQAWGRAAPGPGAARLEPAAQDGPRGPGGDQVGRGAEAHPRGHPHLVPRRGGRAPRLRPPRQLLHHQAGRLLQLRGAGQQPQPVLVQRRDPAHRRTVTVGGVEVVRGILLRVVLVTAAYSAAAFLGRLLVIQPEQLASFWPAAGIGLASLLVRPRKEWPRMVLAIFLANMIVNTATATPPITGRTLVIAAAFGVANCTEPIVAATLVHYVLGTPFRLNHLKDVVGLTVVVALFSNSVTALLGAAVPALAFGAPYWPVWRVWWTADALGILLAAPIILSWATVDWLRAAFTLRQRGPEGVALLIATAVVANLVFGNKELDAGSAFLLTFPYATFPFLLWAAVRLGLRGASLTALTVAVVAVWHTVHHLGPFAATTADVSSQVLSSQAFLAVATLSALMLATVIGERERVEAALHEANVDLEQRIQLRTVELTETNQKLREEVVVREKAEEEVKRSVADLARSNGELQQFAYVASHDLREPLRAVGGVVQLLEQNYKAQMDGRAKEYVTHIV